MKLSIPPRPTLIIAIVLLATNVVTGLITAHAVRARDYSNTNHTYLLTWGMISQRFEEARERKLPHVLPKTNAEIYFGYEDTARFVVRHPTAPAPSNPDSDRQVLLGWAVAADQFHSDNVNIQVDPAVWKAFLADGPKDLPLYWEMRDDLTRAGADKGIIHAEDPMHGMTGDKPGFYKLTAFPRPASPSNSETRSEFLLPASPCAWGTLTRPACCFGSGASRSFAGLLRDRTEQCRFFYRTQMDT